MKVFVVEDSAPVRERLVEMIEATGTHVVVGQATTYDDAVNGIAKTRPDVGIFDIRLARGDGIEALAVSKRLLPSLVCIVMSNYASRQHLYASIGAGARYFLDKSADFERIPVLLAGLSAGGRPKEDA